MKQNNNGAILVIDENPLVLKSTTMLLNGHGYTCIACSNAQEAVEISRELLFDVVLTDIRLPSFSGLTLLDELRSLYPEKPVILMTESPEIETAVEAIRRGAFDLITKPVISDYFINTVQRAVEHSRLREMEIRYKKELESIVARRTQELKASLVRTKTMNMEIIQRFMRIAEYRDTETGDHISRIGMYARNIAEALNMPKEFVSTITCTSSMHDIGKIGIPDNILLKPGALTSREYEIMKTHTIMGHQMLHGSSNAFIQMAASIALYHHERWDGTGYPVGLKGEAIPIEGMIVMLADQYDALRSNRPYKKGFSHEEAFTIITKGDGRTEPGHFNPEVLKAFIQNAEIFDEIFTSGRSINELNIPAFCDGIEYTYTSREENFNSPVI